MLLLHGFPDSSRLWREQIPALNAAGLRTVAPDLRGFGESDRPQDVEAYSVGRSVGDIVAVLDGLGIERAHVVGHDWGAGVAWALALLVPERVDKLVVMSVGHPATFARPPLAQREKSWYMLFFQFPEAEALLERDDWALMREWAATHPDLERVFADLQRPGALTAALELVPRERAPAQRAGALRAAAAGAGRHAGDLEHGRRVPARGRDAELRRARRGRRGATSASKAPATGCSSTRRSASTSCCSISFAERRRTASGVRRARAVAGGARSTRPPSTRSWARSSRSRSMMPARRRARPSARTRATRRARWRG